MDDTTTDGQATNPADLAHVNTIIAQLGSLGLAVYSDITGKPIISSPGPGGSVIPTSTINTTETILIVGMIALALVLILKK